MNVQLKPVPARRPRGKTCDVVENALIAYIFDEMGSREKELVDRHIEACDRCKQRLILTWSAVSAVGAGAYSCKKASE